MILVIFTLFLGISGLILSDRNIEKIELPSSYGGKMATLRMKTHRAGEGVAVKSGDQIQFHFIQKVIQNFDGPLADFFSSGTELDNSYQRVPMSIIAGKGSVLPGLDHGLLGMRVGEKRILTIPPELAYGPRGNGSDIPGNATIRYEIELLSIGEKLKP
jgi:FKBP-type peptidyl-prolyl cis-trans isomerase